MLTFPAVHNKYSNWKMYKAIGKEQEEPIKYLFQRTSMSLMSQMITFCAMLFTYLEVGISFNKRYLIILITWHIIKSYEVTFIAELLNYFILWVWAVNLPISFQMNCTVVYIFIVTLSLLLISHYFQSWQLTEF